VFAESVAHRFLCAAAPGRRATGPSRRALRPSGRGCVSQFLSGSWGGFEVPRRWWWSLKGTRERAATVAAG